MGCRRATSLALIALIVSLCALALLYRLCDGRESRARDERGANEKSEERGANEESEERGARESAMAHHTEEREEPTVHFTHALPTYRQIGLLVGAAKEPIALYGRPTRRGSEQWNYYAVSNNYAPHRLPVFVNGRDSSRLLGCRELSDGDAVDVRGYGAATVALYTLDDAEHRFGLC
jgi:hypothetical protein